MTDTQKIELLRAALTRLMNAGDSVEHREADRLAKEVLEQTK